MTPPIISITCPQCDRTSHNPNDVRERYCGACHQFHDTMPIVKLRAAQEKLRRAAEDTIQIMTAGPRALTNASVNQLTEFIKTAASLDRAVDEYLGVQKLNTSTTREGE